MLGSLESESKVLQLKSLVLARGHQVLLSFWAGFRSSLVPEPLEIGAQCYISNCLTIETDIDLTSENLKQRCAENGWWTPETPFNWREVMSDEGDESDADETPAKS